jgi:Txe/YoeB family toxin of Txe-Axe toxin-antitoxin module
VDVVMASASIQELQESFNDLVQWAEDNILQINIGKTEMLVFRKERKVNHEDRIAYNREKLKVIKCYKYLGITVV